MQAESPPEHVTVRPPPSVKFASAGRWAQIWNLLGSGEQIIDRSIILSILANPIIDPQPEAHRSNDQIIDTPTEPHNSDGNIVDSGPGTDNQP